MIIKSVKRHGVHQLLSGIKAQNPLGALFGFYEHRHQERGKNAYDGDDDEQLTQGERSSEGVHVPIDPCGRNEFKAFQLLYGVAGSDPIRAGSFRLNGCILDLYLKGRDLA